MTEPSTDLAWIIAVNEKDLQAALRLHDVTGLRRSVATISGRVVALAGYAGVLREDLERLTAEHEEVLAAVTRARAFGDQWADGGNELLAAAGRDIQRALRYPL